MTFLPLLASLLASTLALSACAGADAPGAGKGGEKGGAAGPPQRGGELTALEDTSFSGSWPTGLDPATNTTGGANITQMSAIYGGLFRLEAADDGSDARVVPHQAKGYELSPDGLTLTIKLREGLKFTDGTAFDAEAVAENFQRDVKSPCTCAPQWPLADDGISAPDPLTVEVEFTRPYAAVINSFPASNVNWIASPTALEKQGESDFKIHPVGAGPFTVVSNKLSSELVLRRNPDYFKKGLPYLDKLTFQSIGGDQPAYQALQAGQAHAYEGLNTTPLLEQAQSNQNLQTTVQPATSPYVVQFNTEAAPFDDKRAREAIYHATDFDAITKGLFKNLYPVSESFTGPGGLFHQQEVPGYRSHDLAKARQLVQDIGGLKVELGTLDNYVAQQVLTALQTQWKKAGIKVTTKTYQLSSLVQQFNSGEWQSMLQTAGAWDPASGVGVGFRFSSTSPFSGVHDPKLDSMLNDAAASLDNGKRAQLYEQAGKYVSDNAYAPFGLAFAPANLATSGVHGPGLTTKIPAILVNPGIHWDQVWRAR